MNRAKLLRQQLQATFLKCQFSVRSRTLKRSKALNIGWTNGPTTADVEAIAQHKSIPDDEASGEVLLGGNRYVACHRLLAQRLSGGR